MFRVKCIKENPYGYEIGKIYKARYKGSIGTYVEQDKGLTYTFSQTSMRRLFT